MMICVDKKIAFTLNLCCMMWCLCMRTDCELFWSVPKLLVFHDTVDPSFQKLFLYYVDSKTDTYQSSSDTISSTLTVNWKHESTRSGGSNDK